MTTSLQNSSELNLSDRDLLAQFVAKRDEASFRLLVQRHGGLVWSVCQRMLVCLQDREDVFQATFLRLVLHADRKTWHETLGGWLHKVAYRLSLKVCAARSRQQALTPGEEPWGEDDSLEQIQRQDAERALHEAIVQLPSRDRQAIVLHYFQNKSQEEAAAEMGCSLAALKSLLQRSRRKLYLQLGCRGLSCSLALVSLERTLTAATSRLPELIDKAVVLGLNHPVGGGAVPSSPQVEHLSQGEIMFMLQKGVISKSVAIIGCTTLFCLGTGGFLSGIYQGDAVHAALPLADRLATSKQSGEAQVVSQGASDSEKRSETPAWMAREQKILGTMRKSVAVEFVAVPLKECVEYLQSTYEVPIFIDDEALAEADLSSDVPITFARKEITLHSALRQMLKPHGLDLAMKNEALLITTAAQAEATQLMRIYDVREFNVPSSDLVELIMSAASPETWDQAGGAGSIRYFGSDKIVVFNSYRVLEEIEELFARLRNADADNPSSKTRGGVSDASSLQNREPVQKPKGTDGPRADTAEAPQAAAPEQSSAFASGDGQSAAPVEERHPDVGIKSLPIEMLSAEQLKRQQKVLDALEETSDFDFADAPLSEVVDHLSTKFKVPMVLDQLSLDDVGVGSDTPVSIRMQGVSLREALGRILNDLGLDFCLDGESLVIATTEKAAGTVNIRVFDTRGLRISSKEFIDMIKSLVYPETWEETGGNGTAATYGDDQIVISQTYQVLEEVEDLLVRLRQADSQSTSAGTGMF